MSLLKYQHALNPIWSTTYIFIRCRCVLSLLVSSFYYMVYMHLLCIVSRVSGSCKHNLPLHVEEQQNSLVTTHAHLIQLANTVILEILYYSTLAGWHQVNRMFHSPHRLKWFIFSFHGGHYSICSVINTWHTIIFENFSFFSRFMII